MTRPGTSTALRPGARRAPLLLAATLALAAVGWAGPPAAVAQGASLDRVDALVAEGRTAEARTLLDRWWREEGGAPLGRAEEQRSLWLRALLTPAPETAMLDYQRLVVEFPGGPYTDEALLRLAQGAHARGDLPTAAGHYRALLRDHPESPARLEAREWIARWGEAAERVEALGPPASEPPAPGALASEPRSAEPSPSDVGPAEVPASTGAPVPRPPQADSAAAGSWAVQVGAFATRDRAEGLQRRLERAGFDARVVETPANRLLRVRVGRLVSRADTEALARSLREAGFDTLLVDDVPREREGGT